MENKFKQITGTLLMIEPVNFGFNNQTAQNNYFQKNDGLDHSEIQRRALTEFTLMVEKLRAKGLNIIVARDTAEPQKPDAIFPNNWISFHQDGRVVLYPMYAENRRPERRNDILELMTKKGLNISAIVDYTNSEKKGQFLEGTGSMVLDHENKIAYAALSDRTEKELFLLFCNDFQYQPVYFIAYQSVDDKRLSIYHTNIMMCICDKYAIICLNAIDSRSERNNVIQTLVKSGKEIIEISERQMHHFAGNMLQVENKQGARFMIMSQSAFKSLNNYQIERLTFYNKIIPITIPTIETYGGGSVRCMITEVFGQMEETYEK